MLARIDGRQVVLDKLPRRTVGAEIGVHRGNFSKSILRSAKPSLLYLIDPYLHFDGPSHEKSIYGGTKSNQDIMDVRYNDLKSRFSDQVNLGIVKILRKTSKDAAVDIGADELGFVYIDGDHSYDGVKADLDNYFPKVKSGGLIFADDYALGQWWGDGVVKAVNELIGGNHVKIEFVVDGQVCLRKL